MVNKRQSQVQLVGADYIDFFQNRYLDQEAMVTGFRTDEIYEQLLQSLGLSTAQYSLDYGINVIPFAIFNKGSRYSDIFHQLAEAENGHFYQDEEGIFRFENRQRWDTSPFNEVQKIVLTGQVLDSELLDEDHIINVVEVKGLDYVKQPLRPILNYNIATEISPNSTKTLFFEYEDPVLEVTTPTIGGADSYYIANTSPFNTDTDVTSSVLIKSISNFSKASKIVFQNNSSSTVYLTSIVISGRIAKSVSNIYARLEDDSSLTAYEERPFVIENDFIQSNSWANSYGQIILNDYSDPSNLQRIIIRAIPEIQLGDLISWQGRHWRIFGIRSTLSPQDGFIQELLLLQKNIVNYFRVGISTIGGDDIIAP